MHDNTPRPIVGLFAANLRRYRRASNLSQERLAGLAGVDRTYVSSCERGLRNVTIGTLAELARALRVPASALIAEGSQNEP